MNIFIRCGFEFCFVIVDFGFIGGNELKEFMVLFDIGEDIIVYSDVFDYVVNIEMVLVLYMEKKLYELEKDMEKVVIFD